MVKWRRNRRTPRKLLGRVRLSGLSRTWIGEDPEVWIEAMAPQRPGKERLRLRFTLGTTCAAVGDRDLG